MDFTLSLSYQEQNDNKALILTDTSNINATDTNLTSGSSLVVGDMYEIVTQSTLDFTTQGAADNNVGTRFVSTGTGTLGAGDEVTPVTPTAAEITSATLDTTITGVDGIATAKSQVDLYSQFGPFTTQNDMVYTITAALLGDTADSELIDGLYELDYTLGYGGTGTATLNVTILVYGIVKVATYEKLRNINVWYMCTDGCPTDEIQEADLCGAYLSSIENSAYVAKTEELLNMLVVLDNIVKNGSNITW
jgi:hypothetical protein